MINKITPYVKNQSIFKNRYSKFLSQRIIYSGYKTLVISLIYIPMSPSFLGFMQTPCKIAENLPLTHCLYWPFLF